MNLNVTQENLHLFLPSKVSRMVEVTYRVSKLIVKKAVKKGKSNTEEA